MHRQSCPGTLHLLSMVCALPPCLLRPPPLVNRCAPPWSISKAYKTPGASQTRMARSSRCTSPHSR